MSSSQNGLKREASQFDTPTSNKPTKIRRALAACKNCRKQKTRCDHTGGAPCHRCKVLGLDCEFDNETIQSTGVQNTPGSMPTMIPSPGSVTGDMPAGNRMDRFELRMERMERSIHELIAALNPNAAHSQPQPASSPYNLTSHPGQQTGSEEEDEEEDDGTRPTGNTDVSEEQSPAPVEIIRDLASEFLDGQSPKARAKYPALSTGDDIVSRGIVSESQAQELVDIFLREYGKWLGFPPASNLLKHWRHHSPLLLVAACLIASRHLPFSSSLDPLVSALFSESRRQLSLSLLNVPRNVETLQAILILSVWSPLARQERKGQDRPLSGARTLDSWLVSGYGVMLGMTVIRFNDLTRSVAEFKGPRTPVGGQSKESTEGISQRLRVWNHLCLIHLHYCVGTRRPCIIEPSLLERCRAILNVDSEPSNHDRRMVAEINLYSILYRLLQRVTTRARGTEDGGELQAWRDEWDSLFHEDGHQYIEIGYYFAHLMIHSQALKLLESGGRATPDSSPVPGTPSADPIEQKKAHMSAISQLSTKIFHRARRVDVVEIRHVTDIIYFIIAFAGVSLCRLLPSILIFGPAKAEEYRSTFNQTITETVEWLRSVAISEEHIAFKFSEIINGLYSQTLRRELRRNQSASSHSLTPTDTTAPNWFAQPQSATSTGFAQPFPPTPTTYHVMPESPHGTAGATAFSPFSTGSVTYPQQGFGQNTGYDESYFVGLFPELMGPGFVDGGYAAGLGQGVVSGSSGFEDSLGFWGFRNS